MPSPHYRLTVLGPPRLEGPAGTLASTGPRRLALLGVVAAAGAGGITRDRVLGVLWSEAEQERARHSLNQTLYALRRDTRADLITGTTDLRLDPAVCTCDVLAFDAAIAAGRPADALAAYTGPLLDGFFLADAPEFNHWLDVERDRRARQAVTAAEAVAIQAEQDGQCAVAAAAWRRAAELDPFSGRIARHLMQALARAGDAAAALRHADQHAAFLRRELDTTVDPAVVALVEELRSLNVPALARLAPGPSEPAATPEPVASVPPAAERAESAVGVSGAHASPAPSPRRRRWPWAVAAALTVVGVISAYRPPLDYAEGDYFVLGDFVNLTGDTLLTRTAGAAFAAAISQSREIAPLPRPRITEALHRMQRPDTATLLDPTLAREVAIRENVGLVVTGEVLESGSALQVVMHVVDAESGKELRTRARRIPDRGHLLDALDELAADLRRDLGEARGSVGQSVPLPRVTTASLEALRLYDDAQRALRANEVGIAADRLRAAIAIDSNFAQARAAYGAYLVRNNQPREAEPHFVAAERLAAHLPPSESMPIDAQVAAARGRTETAIAAMHSYLKLHPQDAMAWVQLGNYLRGAERPVEALAAFDSAAARMPLATVDELAIAGIWLDEARRLGRPRSAFDSAGAHYERAIRRDSTLATYLYVNHQYGETLVARDLADSARLLFTRMLPRGPNDRARGLRSLGYLAAWEGRWRTAAGLFGQAAGVSRAQEQWTSAARNEALAGMVLVHAGRDAEGVAWLRRAAVTCREHDVEPRMARFVAIALEQAGDHAGATALARWMRERLLAGNPAAEMAMAQVAGVILVGDGRAREGLDSLTRAFAHDSSAFARALLADGLAAAGDLAGAAARFEEVERQVAFGVEDQFLFQLAPYRAGRLHEELGRPAAAIVAYERFLTTVPAGTPADELPLAVREARTRLTLLKAREALPR